MWYVYTVRILLSHQKGGDPTICDNMNGSAAHYDKQEKSDGKRQMHSLAGWLGLTPSSAPGCEA